MANFPLSHITVGGNTYDITHATLLTCTIAQADFSGGAYLADAWLKGATDDLTVQSYSGKTLTDAYDDLVAGHPVYLAIEVNSSITDIIPLSVDAGGWQKIFYGVVSTTGHIYSFKVFDAAMMDDYPTKISKTADSASGGGGGGSVTTYYLYSEWGSPATFATLSSASSCVLKDGNSNNVNISTLATAFAAGTVYIQDADGALTRAITLGYSSGSVSYFVMLMPNNTASAKLRSCNWQSNKYMMLDVTL